MNIAVIGCGFIGLNVVAELIANGSKVTVVDRNRPPPNLADRCKWFQEEVNQYSKFEEYLGGIDTAYFMLTSSVPISASGTCDLESQFYRRFLRNLFAAAQNTGTSQIIFLSSAAVYGQRPIGIPVAEDSVPSPVSAHGALKAQLEEEFSKLSQDFSINVVIARISNPFGFGQTGRRGQGIIGMTLDAVYFRAAATVNVYGSGEQVRDFIYIKDLARALILLATCNRTFAVYNIGTGVGTSIMEVINIIQALTRTKINICFQPKRQIDIDYSVLDVTRFEKEFKLKPKNSVTQGILELVQINERY